MKKKLIIILALAIASVILVFLLNRINDNQPNLADSVVEASDRTGDIPAKIIGDAESASVIIYEYADYGCSHCAEWDKKVKNLIDEYNGKVAVVFRSYDLGFHNGTKAAAAATAAQIQGYWEEYKDLLFQNQSEWLYDSEDKLYERLTEYFKKASNGQGNIEQFKNDINSKDVIKRNKFENEMGKKVNLRGTPLFRINGQNISPTGLTKTVEKLIQPND